MPPGQQLSRAAKLVERRVFLKALALGASVPLALRLSRSATAQAAAAPRRFMVIYIPHGTAPEHFAPRVQGTDLKNFALNMTNESILGPLEPYKSQVNVYEGFQYLGDAETHDGVVNCLTGSTAADTTTPRTSLEHVIAKALNVKPLILGAVSHIPFGLDRNGMLFWNGTPVDPEKSPVKAFDTLFGNIGAPMVNADAQLKKDLLAFTGGEIESLRSTLVGMTREQSKLAVHLTSIQAMQSDTTMTMSACTTKPNLPLVEMVRTLSANNRPDPSNGNDWFYQPANFKLLFQAQLQLAAQALICNAAPIIGLMPLFATCDYDFGPIAGIPGAHHNVLSHTTPQARDGAQYNSPITIDNLKPETRAQFAKAQRWFTQQIVDYLIKTLAETQDPGQPAGVKVLDNTLIYLMSEIGDGADHSRVSEVLYPQTPDSLPLVTIGKCAGKITSGQVVRFPVAPKEMARTVNRPASDLFLTMARAMGAANATFPGQTGVINGVLAS
jgi:hypothetical protein